MFEEMLNSQMRVCHLIPVSRMFYARIQYDLPVLPQSVLSGKAWRDFTGFGMVSGRQCEPARISPEIARARREAENLTRIVNFL